MFIIYASLSPFSGWRVQGFGLAEVLASPLVQTYTAFDAMSNLLAYLPFGLLLALTLRVHVDALKSVLGATLAGLLLSVAMEYLQTWLPSRITLHLGATAVLAVVAFVASQRAAGEFDRPDPPSVVIDEFVGMWVAALAIPAQAYDLGAVFLLFRLFDVVKPAPLPRVERWPGGWGVVGDDIAAGLLARATWWLLQANFDFL